MNDVLLPTHEPVSLSFASTSKPDENARPSRSASSLTHRPYGDSSSDPRTPAGDSTHTTANPRPYSHHAPRGVCKDAILAWVWGVKWPVGMNTPYPVPHMSSYLELVDERARRSLSLRSTPREAGDPIRSLLALPRPPEPGLPGDPPSDLPPPEETVTGLPHGAMPVPVAASLPRVLGGPPMCTCVASPPPHPPPSLSSSEPTGEEGRLESASACSWDRNAPRAERALPDRGGEYRADKVREDASRETDASCANVLVLGGRRGGVCCSLADAPTEGSSIRVGCHYRSITTCSAGHTKRKPISISKL